ncbi:MAG: hypothetical protein LBL84_01975 [Candidatus Nomurabacteria bacterium]|jgi:hypothetical protein|nr:hypothetical protein [Candidatus Nomurabacteria bacterium]
MNKILIIGVYPIKVPRHGGQKRVSAIVDMYHKAGLTVKYSAVFSKLFYSDYTTDDIPVGKMVNDEIMQSPFTGDMACGKAIFSDPIVKKHIKNIISTFNPDVIQVEQDYPYLGLKPLLDEIGIHPKIVMDSHNIEGPMKVEILKNSNVSEDIAIDIGKELKSLEKQLAQDSKLIIACTRDDLDVLKRHKVPGMLLSLAPNGVALNRHDKAHTRYWRDKFSGMGVKRIATFIGSAHPPNWDGFMTMVGKGLGFLPADARIALAGSISDMFEDNIKPDLTLTPEDVTFWLRAYAAGRMSEERLQGIIDFSDVILLPITEGGGSNLKTAEAIVSGKKIVATSKAFRSFEKFKALPWVSIVDKPSEFRSAIIDALGNSNDPRKNLQAHPETNDVLWDNCLKDCVEKVKVL